MAEPAAAKRRLALQREQAWHAVLQPAEVGERTTLPAALSARRLRGARSGLTRPSMACLALIR